MILMNRIHFGRGDRQEWMGLTDKTYLRPENKNPVLYKAQVPLFY
jgi:hypothetical protein